MRPAEPSTASVVAGTAGVLGFFAANQLLSRAALGHLATGPLAFTGVRLLSGAAALALLGAARRRRPSGGSWTAAGSLIVYAVAFSLAYVRVGAGVGALVQFAAVQGTMMGWLVAHGGRPRPAQWLGLAVAFAGVVGLAAPGSTAPELGGTALMIVAGIAWGAYSLLGSTPRDPVAATADNFVRCAPLALPLLLARDGDGGGTGLLLAALSGALASGVGYALWYAVVPALGTARAAIVQLAVPALAALGGAALLGEALTPRTVGCGVAILLGIAISVRPRPSQVSRRHRPADAA